MFYRLTLFSNVTRLHFFGLVRKSVGVFNMATEPSSLSAGVTGTKKPRLVEDQQQPSTSAIGSLEEAGPDQDFGVDEVSGQLETLIGEEEEETRVDVLGIGTVERDVGITEFVGKHQGFFGIVKRRYEDFIVNECNHQKEIVKLTDLSEPEDEKEEKKEESIPSEVISKDDIDKLDQLNISKDSNLSVDLESPDDKDSRRAIHTAIRALYPMLESTLVKDEGEKSVIRVVYTPLNQRKRKRNSWPKKVGKYCKFVLFKKNCDTPNTISLLARKLHVHPQSFGYAGNKDKRGVTVQEVTACRVRASRLWKLNEFLRPIGITLGNFSYTSNPLNLGSHYGNHFQIILRCVEGDLQEICEGMSSFEKKGFINYFGLQRFGSTGIPTYDLGKEIIKQNWKNLAELILKPRLNDVEEVKKARQIWQETQDAKLALEKLPSHRSNSIEAQILNGLVKMKGNDYQSVIQKIHWGTRLMFLHSYQSLIWNNIVSRRIKTYGFYPLLGDLVFKKGTRKAIVLNEKNIDDYDIHDVVLPLFGYSIILPENEVGAWYKEWIEKDGFKFSDFDHPIKFYRLAGAYRKLIVKPENVEWSVLRYDDFQKPLGVNDLEKLEGVTSPHGVVEGGKHMGMKLEFTLPASSYATVALREVMKQDTSPAQQSWIVKNMQIDHLTEEQIIEKVEQKPTV